MGTLKDRPDKEENMKRTQERWLEAEEKREWLTVFSKIAKDGIFWPR